MISFFKKIKRNKYIHLTTEDGTTLPPSSDQSFAHLHPTDFWPHIREETRHCSSLGTLSRGPSPGRERGREVNKYRVIALGNVETRQSSVGNCIFTLSTGENRSYASRIKNANYSLSTHSNFDCRCAKPTFMFDSERKNNKERHHQLGPASRYRRAEQNCTATQTCL